MYVTYHLRPSEIRLQRQLQGVTHRMRLHPTSAEEKLWSALRKWQLHGLNFVASIRCLFTL